MHTSGDWFFFFSFHCSFPWRWLQLGQKDLDIFGQYVIISTSSVKDHITYRLDHLMFFYVVFFQVSWHQGLVDKDVAPGSVLKRFWSYRLIVSREIFVSITFLYSFNQIQRNYLPPHTYIYIYIYIYIKMRFWWIWQDDKISGKVYKSNSCNGFNGNISFFLLSHPFFLSFFLSRYSFIVNVFDGTGYSFIFFFLFL